MFENLEIFAMANGLARHASHRQAIVAENIAQADTPGYLQKDLPAFSDTFEHGTAMRGRSSTRPGHLPMADTQEEPRAKVVDDATINPNGNSVSLEDEIMKSAIVRQQHDMALSVYKSALTVLRTSLGRR